MNIDVYIAAFLSSIIFFTIPYVFEDVEERINPRIRKDWSIPFNGLIPAMSFFGYVMWLVEVKLDPIVFPEFPAVILLTVIVVAYAYTMRRIWEKNSQVYWIIYGTTMITPAIGLLLTDVLSSVQMNMTAVAIFYALVIYVTIASVFFWKWGTRTINQPIITMFHFANGFLTGVCMVLIFSNQGTIHEATNDSLFITTFLSFVFLNFMAWSYLIVEKKCFERLGIATCGG